MDELVKRLRECASGECFNCSQYTETTNASVCSKELMKQVADAIEELRKPKWIPVTERLPEDGQWVLVWGHGQKIPIMMFHESGAWIDDQFEFHTTITHWMPLPEPPKEE